MPSLINYVVSTTDNKVYGLLVEEDNTISLIVTPDTGDLLNWSKFISIPELGDINIYFGKLEISMTCYNNKIFIVSRADKVNKLFVIPTDISEKMVAYPLPAETGMLIDTVAQTQAFYVNNDGKLYLGANDKVWVSSNDGKTWDMFYDFKGTYPLIIKANQDLMIIITSKENPSSHSRKVYLAPMGTSNFQDQEEALLEHDIYAAFFNTYLNSKLLIILDRTGIVKVFNYSIQAGKLILEITDNTAELGFDMPDYFDGAILFDSTPFGGNLIIGLINSDAHKTEYYYNTLQVSNKGKLSVSKLVGTFINYQKPPINWVIEKLITDTTNGKILFLADQGILYLSTNGGKDWSKLEINVLSQ